MKLPPRFSPRRPATTTRRIPATRTEAAIELVRVEFERARLTREITQYSARARAAAEMLDQQAGRGRRLLEALDPGRAPR